MRLLLASWLMGSFPSVPPRALSWVLRKKFLVGIRVDSGFFAESRLEIAYSTGKSGRHGEEWGEYGTTWEEWGACRRRAGHASPYGALSRVRELREGTRDGLRLSAVRALSHRARYLLFCSLATVCVCLVFSFSSSL